MIRQTAQRSGTDPLALSVTFNEAQAGGDDPCRAKIPAQALDSFSTLAYLLCQLQTVSFSNDLKSTSIQAKE